MAKPKQKAAKQTKQEVKPGQADRAHKKERFLEVFQKNGGFVVLAAEAIGVNRNTIWEWRRADKEFERRFEQALDHTTEQLEKEMERRAMHPRHDLLMMFALKGRRPEKYRDNVKVEQTGSVTVVVKKYGDK